MELKMLQISMWLQLVSHEKVKLEPFLQKINV